MEHRNSTDADADGAISDTTQLCITSKDCVRCGFTFVDIHGYIQLKGSYLWVFKNKTTQTRNMGLRAVVDLTSIQNYSFHEDLSNPSNTGWKWKWVLELHDSKLRPRHTKTMSFHFQETDTALTEHILAVLKKYNAKKQDKNEKAEREEQEQEQEQTPEQKQSGINSNVLFASYLLCKDVPYYAVLRDMRLQLFADYACFINHSNNDNDNDNDNNNNNTNTNHQSMRAFDILSEFEKCVPEHAIYGQSFQHKRYAFDLICKPNNDQRVTLVFLSNNERFAFCLHLNFWLTFKCMPSAFLSLPDLSRFEKTHAPAAPLIQEMANNYTRIADAQRAQRAHRALKQLRLFDGIFRVWHKTKTNNKSSTSSTRTTTSVLQAIGVRAPAIMAVYSTVLQNTSTQDRAHARQQCKAGPWCCSFKHHTEMQMAEDNGNGNNRNNSNNTNTHALALAFIRQTQENGIVNDWCKMHACLYAHNEEEPDERLQYLPEHREELCLVQI